MSAARLIKNLYYSYLSQPKSDRTIYRWFQKLKPRKLVVIGLGRGRRPLRLLEAMRLHRPEGDLSFTGIDLFEARIEPATGLGLKQMHQQLHTHKWSGAPPKMKLLPGDVYSALARAANGLTGTDVLLISADQDPEALTRAWFYVPRMLHEGSLVLREQTDDEGQLTWWPLKLNQVEELAAAVRRRAA